MKLSAPIHHLKRQARRLSREGKIPCTRRLTGLPPGRASTAGACLRLNCRRRRPPENCLPDWPPATSCWSEHVPGRQDPDEPGTGRRGHAVGSAAASSSHWSTPERDMLDRFRAIGVDRQDSRDLFAFDCSDAISAGYVIRKHWRRRAARNSWSSSTTCNCSTRARKPGTHRSRSAALKAFARDSGLILVFISQIDRSYDPVEESPARTSKTSACRTRSTSSCSTRPVSQQRQGSFPAGGLIALGPNR